MGAMEQTDSLLTKAGSFSKRVSNLDALTAGEALIEKQMEFTPRIVGGPIDIAVVTPSGAAWIRKKQNCQ
jgi:heme A synthase